MQSTLQPSLTLRGSAPLIVDDRNRVFASFSNGEVKAYNVKTGAMLWTSRLSLPKGSSELERMVDIV